MNISPFGLQNIISHASRERCMTNLKKFRVTLSKTGKQPSDTAAILVPMCYVNGQTSILYTKRATSLRSDSGHISFPGGKTDGLEFPAQTALRETKEEIGLFPDKIDIWGCAQALQVVLLNRKKMMITPVIGWIKNLKEGDLSINNDEVSEVFAVSLELLSNPKNQFYTQFQDGYILPVFVAGEYQIWGITAYVTHMFLSCLLMKDVYKNEWCKKMITITKQ